jgi:hypothetical protein
MNRGTMLASIPLCSPAAGAMTCWITRIGPGCRAITVLLEVQKPK